MTDSERIVELEVALQKIDAIRNDIIGRQSVNWSAHIYPLVAALGKVGIKGAGYDESLKMAKTADERIAELEAQLAGALKEIENQKVIEGVADSYAAVLEVDNAAMSAALKDHWIEICDVGEVCLFCEATVTYKDGITQLQPRCDHKSDCILLAEHLGSRLLKRLEATERLKIVAQKIQDEIYPKDIFVGCDNCMNETCECARGIQITRQLTEALAACDELKEPK